MLSAALLLTGFVSAQKLSFCSAVSEAGEPTDARTSWEVKSGSAIKFLFQDAAPIETAKLLFYIDRKNDDGTYAVFDTKSVKPDKAKSWASIEYTFSQSGIYKISVGDARGKSLAESMCTVQVQAGASKNASLDYYAGARVRFASGLDTQGKPELYQTNFTLASGSTLYICIDHTQALKTSTVSVEISTGDGYKEKVETKKVTVKSSEFSCIVPYVFPKAGEYKVAVYSSDDTFISSGTVSVHYP